MKAVRSFPNSGTFYLTWHHIPEDFYLQFEFSKGVDAEFGVAENVSRFKLKLLNRWHDTTYFGRTDSCLSQAGCFKGQEDSSVL